jgi:hypothetical protein
VPPNLGAFFLEVVIEKFEVQSTKYEVSVNTEAVFPELFPFTGRLDRLHYNGKHL